jgi:NADH-quinone oxidoreductase subunit C
VHVREETVTAADWRARCAQVVGSGATMLDFLTAVDDPGAGEFEVLAHLVDVEGRVRHLLRTRVDRHAAELDSLVDLVAGAGWHEREVHEMFGVAFRGSPDLRPLLTTGDMGHPLRRTTPLPARTSIPWPGAFDPSDRPPAQATGRVAARPRSRPAPPGVAAEWGAARGPAPEAGNRDSRP